MTSDLPSGVWLLGLAIGLALLWALWTAWSGGWLKRWLGDWGKQASQQFVQPRPEVEPPREQRAHPADAAGPKHPQGHTAKPPPHRSGQRHG